MTCLHTWSIHLVSPELLPWAPTDHSIWPDLEPNLFLTQPFFPHPFAWLLCSLFPRATVSFLVEGLQHFIPAIIFSPTDSRQASPIASVFLFLTLAALSFWASKFLPKLMYLPSSLTPCKELFAWFVYWSCSSFLNGSCHHAYMARTPKKSHGGGKRGIRWYYICWYMLILLLIYC